MAGAPARKAQRLPEAPYVPAETHLAEVTLKGVLLGLVLAVLLGAANTYLGLKAGLTVAASIPAAVLSVAVLRLFRRHNILENNMVQTIASAGTSVASGALFTIPALVILGRWTHIHYLETTLVAVCGGLLGVLFTVPIRRALIIEERLPFPEGVATGAVLKAGERGGSGVGALALGGALGALYKLLQSGLAMFREAAGGAVRLGERSVLGYGANLSPALMGVGAVIGVRVAVLVFLGGVLGWFVGIPLYTQFAGDVDGLLAAAGSHEALPGLVWSRRIRYLGVGAMLVGGVWSLVKLRRPLGRALRQGVRSARAGGASGEVPRTEREIPFQWVVLGVLAAVVPVTLLYGVFTGSWAVAGVLALIMLATGFLFSAVGAYMAGIVGSSNTPISGVTILTLIVSAGTLLALGVASGVGPAAAILVAAVIAVAGSIASDNLQDLKAGHIVGATPRKQQYMLMVGAVASAFILAPVMQVLIEGAGGAEAIGSARLPAPQSGLMASVAAGIFGAGLPYGMVAGGALLAVGLIVLDRFLERAGSSFRTPVMPVAVGIYLPVGLSVPIMVGGIAGSAVEAWHRRRASDPGRAERGTQATILFASGLIAGEAIVGILTSFLAASFEPTALRETPMDFLDFHHDWAGLVLLGFLTFLAGYVGVRRPRAETGLTPDPAPRTR